jgi:hypothetical protein
VITVGAPEVDAPSIGRSLIGHAGGPASVLEEHGPPSPSVPTLGVQRAGDEHGATGLVHARAARDDQVEPRVAATVSRSVAGQTARPPVPTPSTPSTPSPVAGREPAGPIGRGDVDGGTTWVVDGRRVSDGARAGVALLAERPLVTTSDRRWGEDSAVTTPPALGAIQRMSPGPSTPSSPTPPLDRAPSPAAAATSPHLRKAPVQRSVQRPAVGGTRPAGRGVDPIRRFVTPLGAFETAADLGFVPAADGTLWSADEGAASLDAETPVQRAEEDSGGGVEASMPTGGTTTTATPTVGPAASPAARGPGTPRSDAELLELCRALYPSLHRRLCRDLLVDRERAGYRTDIRF